MLAGIKKLRLEPGDILVVNHESTLHYLEGLGRVVNFNVPLVFIPQGGVQKLSRQDLLNLLEQLDQSASPAAPSFESPSAPL
jgi:hypothetical protein